MRMCAIFGPKMVHLPQAFFFFWKIIKIIIIYLLAHLIVENFKTILPEDPELWRCAIFGLKMTHENFSENLFMSLVSFTPAYLHAKN